MTAAIPIGARIQVSDEFYTGAAIVLEYDPSAPAALDVAGPYYCHLLDFCDHEMCDVDDDCMGEECRGWYPIQEEGTP